ncbi:MAG: hypothetical protein ABL995_15495 [Bryobacteraceae bacterium]
MKIGFPLCILAAAGIFGSAALGQASDPHADWAGYYAMARGKDIEGLKPLVNLDQLITAHLQPWALAKMQATDGMADDTGQVCQPNGPFRFPVNAGRFWWLPGRDKVIIAYWELNTAGVRRVYLNRKHPRNLLPTWNGDSVGHWEGDTLVVDTIGLNDKSWLFLGMEPHSEEVHMVERIRRIKDGSMIEVDITIDDRIALTSAYNFTRYYKRSDYHTSPSGEPINICNEDAKTWHDYREKYLKAVRERALIVE